MMSPVMSMELARLRQLDLLDEAAQARLASQVKAAQSARHPSYIAAAYRRFIGLGQSVGLHMRSA